MSGIWQELTSKLKSFQEAWALWWTLLGGTLMYLLGYLVTRFQLTLLGVPTSLEVVNEKYFFAGARFLVYLVASLSNFLLLLLPVALVMRLCRFWPGCPRWERFQRAVTDWFSGLELRLIGVVFSILIIQLLMRQCFVLSNVLLMPELPGPGWLNKLLLDESSVPPDLFFALLLGACLVSLALLLASRGKPAISYFERGAEVFLVLVVLSQFLLLPINYSCLIAHKSLPRVKDIGKQALEQRAAWLVWENNGLSTFFLANSTNMLRDRELLTLPTSDVRPLRITGYDAVFRLLFLPQSQVTNSPPL